MEHTPGPWWWMDWDQDDGPNLQTLTARPETRRGGRSKYFPDLPNRILRIEEDETTVADKALIAAAPDLLEACEALLWSVAMTYEDDSIDRAISMARAAIAKARASAAPPRGDQAARGREGNGDG